MTTWLIDTGPLVAYLDRSDPDHAVVGTVFGAHAGGLACTGAVITEAMHFVSASSGGPRALSELVSESRMRVYDLCQPPEMREGVRLMERYRDTPMDFADATLVLLAEALNIHDVLTLDRRGFATYRTRAGHGFRLVLDQA